MVCNDGIFVGVPRHIGLNKAAWVNSALSDATSLHEYFSRACPKGRWRLLAGRNGGPRKAEILSGVSVFAANTPRKSAGVIFFSGHAEATSSGLVLKPFDTHGELVSDTGLPLSRLLSILKGHLPEGKRFLVVLDCCRDGVAKAVADDIPPNVCVLYACPLGDPAHATDKAGILTRSILDALKGVAQGAVTDSCSVATLRNRLGRQLYLWRSALDLETELAGSGAEEIQLPLDRSGIHAGATPNAPAALLRYAFETDEGFRAGQGLIMGSICDWYGIPVGNASGERFVSEHIEIKQARALEIRLPQGCSRWGTADFFEYLLSVPVEATETLVVGWSRVMDFSVVLPLKRVVAGNWIKGAFDHQLVWNSSTAYGRYQGVATLASDTSRTTMHLGCQTPNCYPMRMKHLLPEVPDFLRLVQSLT